MSDLKTWAEKTHPGTEPKRIALQDVVVTGALLNNAMFHVCRTDQPTRIRLEIQIDVQRAIDIATELVQSLTRLRDTR